MNRLHQQAIRILIALQVAVLEHNDGDLGENVAMAAIDEADQAWQRILRQLRNEGT